MLLEGVPLGADGGGVGARTVRRGGRHEGGAALANAGGAHLGDLGGGGRRFIHVCYLLVRLVS